MDFVILKIINSFEMRDSVDYSNIPDIVKAAIKQELLRPFSLGEVEESIKVIRHRKPESQGFAVGLLERRFDNYQLKVTKHNLGESEDFQFTISENGQVIADLIFDRNVDDPEQPWNLLHRIVNARHLNISGSEFLTLCEGYMSVVDDNMYPDVHGVYADSFQPKVTKWLLKNGFHFEKSEDEQIFRDYLENPRNYELINVDYGDGIKNRDLFLFRRSLDEDGGVEREDDLEPLQEVAVSRHQLMQDPHLVKLRLIKDL